MNEQETRVIEQAIRELGETIVELTYQKKELEIRVNELENMKALLTRLLPPDKRIEKLFS